LKIWKQRSIGDSILFHPLNVDREIRQSLRKAYKGQLEKKMDERSQLITEKYAIEAQLQHLRSQTSGGKSLRHRLTQPGGSLSEPTYDVFRRAELMSSEVDRNISDHKSLLTNISVVLWFVFSL
jgi:hypothetical protein